MAASPDVRVLIVGAGFSGLAVAIGLRRAGIDDFAILEKADDLGGTWRENTYPGCACDVQSHLYSYSFAPNPRWTRSYSGHAEIQNYLRDCADRHDLLPRIRFGTRFAGARFDSDTALWTIDTADGATITAGVLVLGMGPLHVPRLPDVPGLDTFCGPAFHSSQWNHDVDLRGKRVAVIGTGASAIQFVPRIAPLVERLTLVQRTPPWVLPRSERRISEREQRLLRRVPALQRLYRYAIYWRNESRLLGMRHPRLIKALEGLARRHIRRGVGDGELARALTPDFRIGCKRILLSNDYYPALGRDNVDVVTHSLAEVTPRGIVTDDGAAHRADAIVFGTGFHVTTAFAGLPLYGRDGVSITEAWTPGPHAHLGSMVPGFPNLFCMLGPNTGLGHNSMVFIAESQTRYILAALRMLERYGAKHIEVRADAEAGYNRDIQKRLSTAMWSVGGCRSWYVDPDGVNRTLWPGHTFTYRRRTKTPDPSAFILTR
ncbi:MAG TPA: NAD(P)/FAD-dependent oxidoreductase [Stackebrandtia sp.]|uniref:flavin-containing monooxygenase n=1 Tax=Stackebrandtia sp. TaxID=2023065 RepID=UPI002D3D7F76|nr:NAD(P)/FAD-dependent oxidoreductase [Stackebrandtia sp.]HZE38440.1 NAD(P)/FAD-dependent oxidoreductase [Stackebrandtia sp.]